MQDLVTENEGSRLLRGSSEKCSISMSDEIMDLPDASRTSLNGVCQTSISWHELMVVNPSNGEKILDGVSGLAGCGEFIALMGASGGGKTTLLNTLQCRNLSDLVVKGDVLVDGRYLGIGITNVSGYVQQDELFLSTLTVREHLNIQARLRLAGMGCEERAERVEAVIQGLGLFNCQNNIIGVSTGGPRISIGESRRLCFASELLDNPPLLFCDEPTTGLDSAMAETVVDIMQGLCREGRTIVCTIHQPSSLIYRKFDKVMFLSCGRVAYFGPPLQAVEFFRSSGYACPENYNPADFIIETLAIRASNKEGCLARVQMLCDEFLRSDEGQTYLREVELSGTRIGKIPESKSRPNFLVQVGALLHRCLLDNWRNKALVRTKIIQKVVMGLIVGVIYFQSQQGLNKTKIRNINGALFYIVMELTFPALFGILSVMPKEYPLVVREYHDGLYDMPSYFVARAISYMPLFALDGMIMITIAYFMVGLALSPWRFLAALGIGVLVEQSAAAFGVMLSSVAPSYPVAVSVASPILTCLMLTGGLYANLKEMPSYISWLQFLSWFRFGFEAFAINQWEGAANQTTRCVADSGLKDVSILKDLAFHAGNFWWDIGAMIGFTTVFYLFGFVGLLIRVRLSR